MDLASDGCIFKAGLSRSSEKSESDLRETCFYMTEVNSCMSGVGTSRKPNEGCILRIHASFPSLRLSEQKVAQYILDHPEVVIALSVTEVARRSGVSDATVVKFCQRIGYTGFQEMKINLAQEMPALRQRMYGEIDTDSDAQNLMERVIVLHKQALDDTARILDQNALLRAIDAIKAANTVHIYGVGASGVVAQDLEAKLLRIDMTCHAFCDTHMASAMAALLGPGDVALAISHSGSTKDTVEALQIAEQARATTICITNFLNSPITRAAHIVLLTAANENIFRSAALNSRIAQLAVVDMLFVGTAQARYDHTVASLNRTRDAVANKRY
jgi:DNA-binding MurR/RpiR family transcriptional regulator